MRRLLKGAAVFLMAFLAACGGDAQKTEIATASSALAASATSAGTYVGCYTDNGTRALPQLLAESGATADSCIAAAKQASLAYAGLQYGGECWAGNTLGISKVTDSQCNMPCSSDKSEACGGSWRNTIYSTVATSPPPPTPTPTPTPGTPTYVGCYTDNGTRALPSLLAESNVTVESCVAAAKQANLAYAGLQDGGECWAGNTLGFSKVNDSQCSTRCWANSAEICGGPWLNSVYSTAATSVAVAVAVAVNPKTATVVAKGSQAFTCSVTGSSDTACTWSVQEGASGGTITSTGVYAAPTNAGTYHVVAKSHADSTQVSTATVAVSAPLTSPPPPSSNPPPSYNLTISISGSGTVLCNGGSCATSYAQGSVLTLVASAASGYTFAAWTGDCAGQSSCSLTMAAGHSVGAQFVTSVAGACNAVQTIIDDMTLAGVQTSNGWDVPPLQEQSPRNAVPWWADHITGWGEVYRDHSLSRDTNTRVEIRNFKVYVRINPTDSWQQIDFTVGVADGGQFYCEDFYVGCSNGTAGPDNVVTWSDGGSAALIPLNENGHVPVYHFWPSDGNVKPIPRISVASGGTTRSIQGVVVVFEARLVVADPSQRDDRSIAKYVASAGADYYGSGTCCAESQYSPQGEIGEGRKKYVSNDWQRFNFSTNSSSELHASPPPLDCIK